MPPATGMLGGRDLRRPTDAPRRHPLRGRGDGGGDGGRSRPFDAGSPRREPNPAAAATTRSAPISSGIQIRCCGTRAFIHVLGARSGPRFGGLPDRTATPDPSLAPPRPRSGRRRGASVGRRRFRAPDPFVAGGIQSPSPAPSGGSAATDASARWRGGLDAGVAASGWRFAVTPRPPGAASSRFPRTPRSTSPPRRRPAAPASRSRPRSRPRSRKPRPARHAA